MYLRQLEYVLAVAEEQSFSKAAKKLYIAQPSLSQNIQSLENELGAPLFDRTTARLSLTYAGEQFVQTARTILDLYDGLLHKIDDIGDLKTGRLTVGIPHFRGTILLPGILPIFEANYPGIEVNIIEGTSTELEDLAIRGKTDFTIMNLPLQSEQLAYEPILTEDILVAVPPDHPLKCRAGENSQSRSSLPRIQLSELREEPFLLLKPGQRLRQTAENLFQHAGIKPTIKLESRNIETVHCLVAAGMGVSLIPETVAWFNRISPAPLYFSLAGQEAAWVLVVAYRKGRYLSRIASEFIRIMKEILDTRKLKYPTCQRQALRDTADAAQ